jgi:hypothetical protein
MTCPDVRREREVERWHTGRTGSLTHARLPVRAQTEISRESAAATRPPFPHYSTHMGGGEGGDVEKEESLDGGNLQTGSPGQT